MTYAFTAEGRARYPSKSNIRRLLEMLLLGILAAAAAVTYLGLRKRGGDNPRGTPPPSSSSPSPPPPPARETNYLRYTYVELRVMCRERGLSGQGKKDELGRRLEQDDARR